MKLRIESDGSCRGFKVFDPNIPSPLQGVLRVEFQCTPDGVNTAQIELVGLPAVVDVDASITIRSLDGKTYRVVEESDT